MNSSIPHSITKYRDMIDKGVKEAVKNQEGKLGEMVNYHLGYLEDSKDELDGKAVRSSLCLFSTEALGGDPQEALPAAVALELVHNFSLVHDDIQDHSELRRGRESVMKMWGKNQAINAGDGIKDLSMLAFFRLEENCSSDRTNLEAIRAISEHSLRMIEGQVKDLVYSEKEKVTTSEYLNMIEGKTCALLEASFYLGGLYSCIESGLSKLAELGKHLGYIYQIRDDFLGIWGKPEHSGKSAEKDLIEKKKTYPIIYALQNARGKSLEKLEEIYANNGKMSDEQILRVREILDETGAKSGTERIAEEHWNKAKNTLSELDLTEKYSNELEQLDRKSVV